MIANIDVESHFIPGTDDRETLVIVFFSQPFKDSVYLRMREPVKAKTLAAGLQTLAAKVLAQC